MKLVSSGPPEVGDFLASGPVPPAVGRFRILKRLGSGGMGEVFLAFDEVLRRKIALKRILPQRVDDPGARRRFEIEAKVTAILQHPAIIPVYQYLDAGAESFYTMRPIEGTAMSDLLAQLRADRPGMRDEWPTARLVRLFLQAAGAVAFAHSRGVVHRDLKPGNIMIGPFEEVLVLDWGMAKVIEAGPPPAAADLPPEVLAGLDSGTASRYQVGTPAYMAPEILRNGPASFSTDLYSLGLILYELLALRFPWTVKSLEEMREAQKRPPVNPARLQPGRAIPPDLGRAALKALEYDPRDRFDSVAAFAREVAHALEGRARWSPDPATLAANWRLAGGRLAQEDGEMVLGSRSPTVAFRYFCLGRFTDDVLVEFEFCFRGGGQELTVWLNAAEPRNEDSEAGYSLMVLPGRRKTLSFRRSRRVVAGAKSPRYQAGRWYRAEAARESDRFSLRIDGEEVYVYHDPMPLGGGFVGLMGRGDGLRLRGLRVCTHGASATISCLAVPAAFFNRRLYEDARAEYNRIAASHPGRNEGRMAGFRSGLCLLEMARQETDAEVRSMILAEARDSFAGLGPSNDSCLSALGLAMVAVEEGDLAREREALESAFRLYGDDPCQSTVREWLLGRLHSLDSGRRRALAELLPLAISQCMEGWGRRVVRDIVDDVRKEWEIPSFMTSRGRFRENDPVSRAEAKVFFAFWADRPETIEEAMRGLAASRLLRPHHLTDGVLALLELGRAGEAARMYEDLGRCLPEADPRTGRVDALCRTVLRAASGDHEEAAALCASCEPDPSDRAYTSARLWVVRSLTDAGLAGEAIRFLRLTGPPDSHDREQQAWLHLQLGHPARAIEHLEPLIERGDHRSGKNLCNFLYGAYLLAKGREEEARRTFAGLEAAPWPRTWTLGSHYAVGRLGGGRLEAYLEGAFSWERRNLGKHAQLLAAVGGRPPQPLPPGAA